jgi:hypothetical protein
MATKKVSPSKTPAATPAPKPKKAASDSSPVEEMVAEEKGQVIERRRDARLFRDAEVHGQGLGQRLRG